MSISSSWRSSASLRFCEVRSVTITHIRPDVSPSGLLPDTSTGIGWLPLDATRFDHAVIACLVSAQACLRFIARFACVGTNRGVQGPCQAMVVIAHPATAQCGRERAWHEVDGHVPAASLAGGRSWKGNYPAADRHEALPI